MVPPGSGPWANVPTPELEKMVADPGRPEAELASITAELTSRYQAEFQPVGGPAQPGTAPPRATPPPPPRQPPLPRQQAPRQQPPRQPSPPPPPRTPPPGWAAPPVPPASDARPAAVRRPRPRWLRGVRLVLILIAGFFLLIIVIAAIGAHSTNSGSTAPLGTTCATPQGTCLLVSDLPVGDGCVCNTAGGEIGGTVQQ